MEITLKGSADLPGSKSESNRALMIAAYGGFPSQVENLSEAHDTQLLQQLLAKISEAESDVPQVIDCEDAGTVARFLLTYLACREGIWIMTGTERLRQRPIRPLVDALRQLGADIVYMEGEGALPLQVNGRLLKGGAAEIDVSQSSQFVSSLILAAPTWEHGLSLSLKGEAVSIPYLTMSLSMMRYFGADVQQQESRITIRSQQYQPHRFEVSADWSGAAPWYELVALAGKGSLLLRGLHPDSLQGDSRVVEMFKPFGVETSFEKEGVRLRKTSECFRNRPLTFDVTDTPDLFPSIFATCVALNCSALFLGTKNLMLKESNRVDSMISELSKKYTFINIIEDNSVIIKKSLIKYDILNRNGILFSTHQDHRVLMALAPLSTMIGPVSFDCPEVVSKSYPSFLTDFESVTTF